MHVVLYSSVPSQFGNAYFILGIHVYHFPFISHYVQCYFVNKVYFINKCIDLLSLSCQWIDWSQLGQRWRNLEYPAPLLPRTSYCLPGTTRSLWSTSKVFSMLLPVFWLGCPAPPIVTNARVLNPGATQWPTFVQVTYLCDVGFRVQGQGTITCQANRQWTTAPTCSFIQQPCKFHIPFDWIKTLLNPFNCWIW